MNRTFTLHMPVKLLHCDDAANALGDLISPHDKIAIISSKSGYESHSIGNRISAAIKTKATLGPVVLGAPPNCPASFITTAVDKIKGVKVTKIIAIGGGSSIDCAKAVSLMLTHTGSLQDYAVDGQKGIPGITNRCIPLIVIPTIFGTGGEISPAAVVNFPPKRLIIVSSFIRPMAAIIEPRLATSVPIGKAKETAFDAFIQGLESFISVNTSSFSQIFAEEAMKNALQGFIGLKTNTISEDTAETLFMAGVLSSIAISISGVGAIHALSDALSANFNISHGVALAAVAVPIFKKNSCADAHYSQRIGKLIQENYFLFETTRHATHNTLDTLSLFRSMIREFNIDLPQNLKSQINNNLGMLVKEAQNPDMLSNPISFSDQDIEQAYLEALEEM